MDNKDFLSQIVTLSKTIKTSKDPITCDGNGIPGCRITIPVGGKYLEVVEQLGKKEKFYFSYCENCMKQFLSQDEKVDTEKAPMKPLSAKNRQKAIELVGECKQLVGQKGLVGKLDELEALLVPKK